MAEGDKDENELGLRLKKLKQTEKEVFGHQEPLGYANLYETVCRFISKTIVRENLRNKAKNVKSHDFLVFEKSENVEVITYMPIVLKTTVTTLSQFCCLSHNSC